MPALTTQGNEVNAELCWSYRESYWDSMEARWWVELGEPCCQGGSELVRRWAGGERWCDGPCGCKWRREGSPFWRCTTCDHDYCEACIIKGTAWARGKRRVPADGSCLYWAVMASTSEYDAEALRLAADGRHRHMCNGCSAGRQCESAHMSLCGRMSRMRQRAVALDVAEGRGTAHRAGTAAAEERHVHCLADTVCKRIIVVDAAGDSKGYGTGEALYVAWDGTNHFEGMSKEQGERLVAARRAEEGTRGGAA